MAQSSTALSKAESKDLAQGKSRKNIISQYKMPLLARRPLVAAAFHNETDMADVAIGFGNNLLQVNGVALAALNEVDDCNGLALALRSELDSGRGMIASIIVQVDGTDGYAGLSIGSLTSLSYGGCGLSVSVANAFGGYYDGVALAPLINATDELNGVAAAGMLNVCGDVDGAVVALINKVKNIRGLGISACTTFCNSFKGVLISPITVTEKPSTGIAIGLLHIRSDMPWYLRTSIGISIRNKWIDKQLRRTQGFVEKIFVSKSQKYVTKKLREFLTNADTSHIINQQRLSLMRACLPSKSEGGAYRTTLSVSDEIMAAAADMSSKKKITKLGEQLNTGFEVERIAAARSLLHICLDDELFGAGSSELALQTLSTALHQSMSAIKPPQYSGGESDVVWDIVPPALALKDIGIGVPMLDEIYLECHRLIQKSASPSG